LPLCGDCHPPPTPKAPPAYSRATQALVDQLTADRGRALGRR